MITVLLPLCSASYKCTLEVERSIADPTLAIEFLPKMRIDSTIKVFDCCRDGDSEEKNCKKKSKRKRE